VAAPLILLLVAIVIVVMLALLWVARGVDAATRLLCRDTVRRLGAGYRFEPGAGFRPNRIVAETPGYALVAELSPGRRTGWRLDVTLEPRGFEYREPFGREARRLLTRGQREFLGETRIERGAIRHGYHQGALVDTDRLIDIIRFVVELHEAIRRKGTEDGA
jgi:hypothetical protein